VCANTRASAQGAPGCARGPEEDGIAREQELVTPAVWQNRSNYSGSSALLIAVQLQSA
jgi:hypothetical protein